MTMNLLKGLKNIIDNPANNLSEQYLTSNRINNVGSALETYIKDAFCNTFTETEIPNKLEKYSEVFSYLGNQNNPPDIMIRGGDAIEVKKIQTDTADLALNSSYPKDRLYSESPMITRECRECEAWNIKDLIYSVGVVKTGKIKFLTFVYGDCYCADKSIYERVKDAISNGLRSLEGITLSPTKELGRINEVDPLGITNLRIRGMWQIKNPLNVFDYAVKLEKGKEFQVVAIMSESKYLSFPDSDRKNLEEAINSIGGNISDIKLKSPNNPAKLINSKVISFSF